MPEEPRDAPAFDDDFAPAFAGFFGDGRPPDVDAGRAGGAPTDPFAVVVGRAADPRDVVPRAPDGRDAGRRDEGGVGRREGT